MNCRSKKISNCPWLAWCFSTWISAWRGGSIIDWNFIILYLKYDGVDFTEFKYETYIHTPQQVMVLCPLVHIWSCLVLWEQNASIPTTALHLETVCSALLESKVLCYPNAVSLFCIWSHQPHIFQHLQINLDQLGSSLPPGPSRAGQKAMPLLIASLQTSIYGIH